MKKLLKVLVVLSLVLTLGACSSNSSSSDDSKVDKIFKVGVVQLAQHNALDAATKGFKEELEKKFSNIVVDVKNASGDSANCSTIVNGFVTEGYDLIMANATPALQAAVSATEDIPILGTSVTEYGVALGIDNFSGVTGMNVSGTSDLAPLDEQAKMIIDLIPNVKTVGIIYCSSEANSVYQVKEVTKFLEDKGIEVIAKSFVDSVDLAQVAIDLSQSCDAIYVPTDNQAANFAGTIASSTSKPIICGEEGTCVECGVATLTIDYYELGKVTGDMAAKILSGEANIAEMPIEYFPNPVKKFNKEFADKFSIEIPSDYIEIK